MMVRLTSRFFMTVLFLYISLAVSCGRQSDERGADTQKAIQSAAQPAQEQVVYCDDVQQNRGLPYEYPGQDQCIKGPDGEPLVDVRPGAPGNYTNPGQAPGYRTPRNSDPRYQNPNPNQPQWQTPGTYPNNPTNPNQPQWQTPGTYPNNPNTNPNTPNNNPNYNTPGYDGEPLPY